VNIILPIHQKYVDKIFSGEKKYEFRRIIPSFDIENILIYSTRPVRNIVGNAKVGKVYFRKVSSIWEATKQYAGICEQDFWDYFSGKEYGYTIELLDVLKFDNYVDLKDFNISVPQNFIYVNNKTYKDITFKGIKS